jgi:hypothetical protein
MNRALGVTLGVLFISDLASAADLFDSGLKEARANEASAEGRVYAGAYTQQLGPVLQRAMQECFPASVPAAGTNFTVVFAVRENGTPAQLMVRPESTSAACVLRGIETAQLPAPPRPDWWVFLNMAITP